MKVYDNPLYRDDIKYVASLPLPWEKLKDSSVVISGATGMIGSSFIDVIMEKNLNDDLNCKVYALIRNVKKAEERFSYCIDTGHIEFRQYDINDEIDFEIPDVGYVIHLASNTHPVAYATEPISTITTNIIGTRNMLEFAFRNNAKRCAFASSNEIYGENRGDKELFDEGYCGYIDCNTLRAGYPESKRCGEALCQAYIREKEMDVVVPRFTRSYGPTMLMSDTKAISQFIKKGVAGEDIVLKSAGNQFYSYTYVTDAVSGLFYVILCGECGEAYNISDGKSDITLADLAKTIADHVGSKVVFEIPDATEQAGYSKATKARIDGTKLKNIGWNARYDIKGGIGRTIEILKQAD